MPSTSQPMEIALGVFEEIRSRFPALAMTLDREPGPVDLALDIPAQRGLLFAIHLNLQNRDELHLGVADGFWLEWFPCTTPAIVDAYKEAVCGLIAGRIRILEYRVNGKYVRGYLQQPDGTAWKTIGRSHRRFAWPWRRTEDRVLQNVAAGDRPLEPADDPRNPDGQH